jgi:hypothetical protein
MASYPQFLAYSDADLAKVDPLVMNLMVAKSIPSLVDLDIPRYQRQADHWAEDVRRRLPSAEKVFWKTPEGWRNDINFFRLGVLCGYLEHEIGIAYNEDQRYATEVYYTDPSDLFLNGVMDTRQGTCANMSALHVAVGWRLGWPVSLACVRSHYICRYDDGAVKHNIEPTQAGYGGFKSDPDAYLIERYELPPKAISSGSDLRAVTPRELLGIFIGFRGRHMNDTNRLQEAERDYLQARQLFPSSRWLYIKAMAAAIQQSGRLFEPDELGSPQSLAEWIIRQYRMVWPAFQDHPKRRPFENVVSTVSV